MELEQSSVPHDTTVVLVLHLLIRVVSYIPDPDHGGGGDVAGLFVSLQFGSIYSTVTGGSEKNGTKGWLDRSQKYVSFRAGNR